MGPLEENARFGSRWQFDEFNFNLISDAALGISDVPEPDTADWQVIAEFALTFNGYAYCGSLKKCAHVANNSLRRWEDKRALPLQLADLRTCLFFEQRRWRHFELEPDKEAIIYITALLAAIRRIVANTDSP